MYCSKVGPTVTLWTGYSLAWQRGIAWLKVMQILKYQEHFEKLKTDSSLNLRPS